MAQACHPDSTGRKHQRISMEARKCETGEANQISASMTNSKHAHTRTHTTHTYTGQNTQNVMLSCLTQEEVDVFKIGFKVVGESAYGGKIIMKAVSLVRSITSPRK